MNRMGRPRGTGGKPTAHATSEKNAAANRERAKLPRPGSCKPMPADKLRAYKADAIGKRLCLETMVQASRYLRANRKAMDLLDEELSQPVTSPTRIAALAEARMSPSEMVRMMEAVHNRWGQPPRSVLEVNSEDRPPIIVAAPFDSWTRAEEDHAGADSGRAGNGHANGHTEH